MADTNEPAGQRDRSPAFPVVPLETAITRLVEFEAHFKRSPARPERVGDAWGIKNKAYFDRITAALRYFGLLEYQGVGKDRSIIISDEGRKYLRAQQEQTKQEVVKTAAIRPKQIAIFWEEWGSDRPADAACLDDLMIKYGFSEGGARDFLRVYDATISFAKLSASDKIGSTIDEDQRGADDDLPLPGGPMETQNQESVQRPTTRLGRVADASVPLRVVMLGNRLDIQASVDLEGLKKLQAMLAKYQSILEMMEPEKDEAAN